MEMSEFVGECRLQVGCSAWWKSRLGKRLSLPPMTSVPRSSSSPAKINHATLVRYLPSTPLLAALPVLDTFAPACAAFPLRSPFNRNVTRRCEHNGWQRTKEKRAAASDQLHIQTLAAEVAGQDLALREHRCPYGGCHSGRYNAFIPANSLLTNSRDSMNL
jgi:hypothetical protein